MLGWAGGGCSHFQAPEAAGRVTAQHPGSLSCFTSDLHKFGGEGPKAVEEGSLRGLLLMGAVLV